MTTVGSKERYSLTVTLLEDLHTGTGTGAAGIDSIQLLGRDGSPMIRATHLKGLLRSAAEELQAYGLCDQALVDRLFGKRGKRTRGALVMTSLRLKQEFEEKDNRLTWTSTARKKFSRVPCDRTLRTTEYVAAGFTFEGKIELRNADDDLVRLLEQCVQMTDCLGSNRNRGDGLVTMQLSPETPESHPLDRRSDAQTRLRIIFQNLDPISLPVTGFPGNPAPVQL